MLTNFFYLLTPILFFFSNISENKPIHALHLSAFEIIKNSGDSIAKIQIRVFQDDFRDAIKNANPKLEAIANNAFLNNRKTEIELYFQQHFQFIFDNKKYQLSLLDSQAENDIYWFRFDLNFPKKWQKSMLQADYLMELFDDQSNIGSVILDGEKQFFRFTKGDVSFELN